MTTRPSLEESLLIGFICMVIVLGLVGLWEMWAK